MPDSQTATARPIPEPVRLALTVLEGLRADNPELAESLAKALPAYALRRAQAGDEVTLDILRDAALAGPDSLKSAFARTTAATAAPQTFLERYEATFPREARLEYDPASITLTPTNIKKFSEVLLAAAHHGETHEADRIMRLVGDAMRSNRSAELALAIAAREGHSSLCNILVNHHNVPMDTHDNLPLRLAIENNRVEVVSCLRLWNPKCELNVTPAFAEAASAYLAWLLNWTSTTGVKDVPPGLYLCDPRLHNTALFQDLQKCLRDEDYNNEATNRLIFNTIALLQTPERIFSYVRKYGMGGDNTQPLHDAIYMIQLPHTLDGVDLAAWGDAVLQHGPKMARLARFCNKLPQPIAEASGKKWSYQLTFEAIAAHGYDRAEEHPDLARLCLQFAIVEEAFNTALDLVKTTPPHQKNLPNLAIDGARFGMPGTVFRQLPPDDLRGLVLGHYTGCCQSIDEENGGACARDGMTSPDSCFYVVERLADGKILGQSWAWRGADGEMCFDSFEAYRSQMSTKKWRAVLHETVKDIAHDTTHDITAVHFGIGGKTPRQLSRSFQVTAQTQPRSYTGYRDSKNQRIAWRR